jgi:hypothetical protein
MVTSSLVLGVVPPPPLIVVNNASGIFLRNINELLAFCLRELGLSFR